MKNNNYSLRTLQNVIDFCKNMIFIKLLIFASLINKKITYFVYIQSIDKNRILMNLDNYLIQTRKIIYSNVLNYENGLILCQYSKQTKFLNLQVE